MTTINPKLPYWHHQLALSWYHHQPESHQQSLNQSLGCSDRQTPGPIDRTPETPGSGKNCDKSDKNMIKQRSKILKITSILVVTVFSSTKGDLLTPGNNKDGGDDNESHDFYKLQLMVNRTDRDTHH